MSISDQPDGSAPVASGALCAAGCSPAERIQWLVSTSIWSAPNTGSSGVAVAPRRLPIVTAPFDQPGRCSAPAIKTALITSGSAGHQRRRKARRSGGRDQLGLHATGTVDRGEREARVVRTVAASDGDHVERVAQERHVERPGAVVDSGADDQALALDRLVELA